MLPGDPLPPPPPLAGVADVKTHFLTREGLYRLVPHAEYARPAAAAAAAHARGGTFSAPPMSQTNSGAPGGGAGQSLGGAGQPAPVRVSFTGGRRRKWEEEEEEEEEREEDGDFGGNTVVFNIGRELFVYPFSGLRKAPDKPLDKRIYKGTCPTCHDFGVVNSVCSSPSENNGSPPGGGADASKGEITPLLVGFTQGQIQLIDPVRKELSKLYNEERLIEKSRVSCIKWIPGSPNLFLASFTSGQLYVFNHELLCPPNAPVYQIFKQGEGFSIFTCKTKSTRNPLYKWSVGQGSITEFAFSPCGHYLAVVSQDGYLRVFNYDSMELIGLARSYFGGLTCVSWSPDAKYIVCGGEDDLITIYSVKDKRVVVRGQGHRSYVTQVAFDEFNLSYGDVPDGLDFSGSDEEGVNGIGTNCVTPKQTSKSANCDRVTCYRVGSVGEDTQLCLWDLTEDILTKATSLSSLNAPAAAVPSPSTVPATSLSSLKSDSVDNGNAAHNTHSASSSTTSSTSLTQRFASLNFGDKHKSKTLDKKKGKETAAAAAGSNSSLSSQNVNSTSSAPGGTKIAEYVKLGSPQCPKINEIPLIEPLVCKKVAHERLTSLTFLDDCIVTSCQEGYICTWARPGKQNGAYAMGCPGSPLQTPSKGGGGTIV